MRKLLIGGAVSVSLLTATTAQAAETRPCVTLDEARALVAYVVPAAIHRLGEACASQGPAGSYLKTGLPALEQRYAAGRDAAWPLTRSAIGKFAGMDKDGVDMSKLSDAALRPLADEIISSKLDFKVAPSDCSDAEEIVQALDPIAPEHTLDLFTAILGVVSRKDKGMNICPREAAGS